MRELGRRSCRNTRRATDLEPRNDMDSRSGRAALPFPDEDEDEEEDRDDAMRAKAAPRTRIILLPVGTVLHFLSTVLSGTVLYPGIGFVWFVVMDLFQYI